VGRQLGFGFHGLGLTVMFNSLTGFGFHGLGLTVMFNSLTGFFEFFFFSKGSKSKVLVVKFRFHVEVFVNC
jgi:hypothetical protein